jgi:hypothetical protein
MLSLWNCVQSAGEGAVTELETLSDVCACADVLAVASISHNGAIVSNKPTILTEAVCFL